jgi:hypothetical protein
MSDRNKKKIDNRPKRKYTVEDLLEKFGKKYPDKKDKKKR